MSSSSYWHSAFLWLASFTSNRLFDPQSHPRKKDSTTPSRQNSNNISQTDFSQFEFEMCDVVVDAGGVPGIPRKEQSTSHARAQSEGSNTPFSSHRPPQQLCSRPTFNTLPRSHKPSHPRPHSHSRSSSYAPVLIVPGVVNSSFLLFSPELRHSQPSARKSNRMRTFSEKYEEHIGEGQEQGQGRKANGMMEEREREDSDGSTETESQSESESSRRSFDSQNSFGSSYTSDTSYSSIRDKDVVEDDHHCTISYRSPYVTSIGD